MQSCRPADGTATAINFQPPAAARPPSRAICPHRLGGKPGRQCLRANGIEVTAIHSHMLTEQPRLIFLHFWATTTP